MECLDDCHSYLLNTETSEIVPLRFYEMRVDGTKINGVTNEEVIKVLLHRIRVLNERFPCIENAGAISALDNALGFLELRTQDRIRRGVEGKHLP